MSAQDTTSNKEMQKIVSEPTTTAEAILSQENPSSRRSSTTSSLEIVDDPQRKDTNDVRKSLATQPESLPAPSTSNYVRETKKQKDIIASSLPASLSELTARTEKQRSLVDDIEISMDIMQREQHIDSSLSSSSSSSSSSSQNSDLDQYDRTEFLLADEDEMANKMQRDSVRDSLMKLIDLDKKLIDDLKKENESLTRALDINNQYLKQKKLQQEKHEKEIEFLEEKLLLLEIENRSLRDHIQRLESQNNETKNSISYPSLGGLRLNMDEEAIQSDEQQRQQQPGDGLPGAIKEPMNSCRLIQLQFDEPSSNIIEPQVADELMTICENLELKLRSLGKKDHFVRLLHKQLHIFKKDFKDGLKSKTEAQQQIESLQQQIHKLSLDREQNASSRVTHEQARHKNHHSKHHHERPHNRNHDHHEMKTSIHNSHNLEKEKRLSRHIKKREMKAAMQAAKRAAFYNTMIHKHQLYLQQAQSTFDKIKTSSVLSESVAAKHFKNRRSSRPEEEDRPHRHSSRRQKMRHMQKEVLHDILATTNKAVATGYKLASSGVSLALDKLQEMEQKHDLGSSNSNSGHHNTATGVNSNPLIDLIGQVTELAVQALRPMVTGPQTPASARH